MSASSVAAPTASEPVTATSRTHGSAATIRP